jgi:hypothetical protein
VGGFPVAVSTGYKVKIDRETRPLSGRNELKLVMKEIDVWYRRVEGAVHVGPEQRGVYVFLYSSH